MNTLSETRMVQHYVKRDIDTIDRLVEDGHFLDASDYAANLSKCFAQMAMELIRAHRKQCPMDD